MGTKPETTKGPPTQLTGITLNRGLQNPGPDQQGVPSGNGSPEGKDQRELGPNLDPATYKLSDLGQATHQL